MKRAAVVLLALLTLHCSAHAQMLRLCETVCPPGWVCYRPGCIPVYGQEPREHTCPTER